jgi:three-Cys-motif partner protein
MKTNKPQDGWGGPWTEKKLNAFSKYVRAYLTIMKKHPYWKTIYFDGFAGSGDRKAEQTDLAVQLQITSEEAGVYKGAAERMMRLPDDLSFDFFYFVDANEDALKQLESKLKEIPEADGKKLAFRSGDANHWLIELSKTLKNPNYAALVFLDPFGMQINWESIESFRGTRSDVWILIPTGVIVNRLLDKKAELKYSAKLQSFFGIPEEEIREKFYLVESKQTLFGEEEIVTKVAKPIEKIAKLYVQRLKTIWTHVTEEPLRLNNTRGTPIFHFVFASNNKNAAKIAKQIIQKT